MNKEKINYSIGPRREGDVDEIYSDNKKVEDLLAWQAEQSVLQAMKDAWNWEINKNR